MFFRISGWNIHINKGFLSFLPEHLGSFFLLLCSRPKSALITISLNFWALETFSSFKSLAFGLVFEENRHVEDTTFDLHWTTISLSLRSFCRSKTKQKMNRTPLKILRFWDVLPSTKRMFLYALTYDSTKFHILYLNGVFIMELGPLFPTVTLCKAWKE